MPRITVIMRSMNSGGVIGKALEGLFSQRFKDFELLCVDSGSTDDTLDILGRYDVRLIQIPAGSYYPGRVLNMAMEKTDAETVVFQNSDVIPSNDRWLETLLAGLEPEGVCGAFSQQLPAEDADLWVQRDYAWAFGDGTRAAKWGTFFSLASSAIKREYWEMHRFYTSAYASEDVEWSQWMRRHDHPTVYVPESLCVHSHNLPLGLLYKRKFIEGEADVFIFRKKPSLAEHAARMALDVVRDARYCLPKGALGALLYSPLQRMIYHAGHYHGMRVGYRRVWATVGWKALAEMDD